MPHVSSCKIRTSNFNYLLKKTAYDSLRLTYVLSLRRSAEKTETLLKVNYFATDKGNFVEFYKSKDDPFRLVCKIPNHLFSNYFSQFFNKIIFQENLLV